MSYALAEEPDPPLSDAADAAETVTLALCPVDDPVDDLIDDPIGLSDDFYEFPGEFVHLAHRMIVTTEGGVFEPAAALCAGASILRGQIVGTVNGMPLRSRFGGHIQIVFAVPGERLRPWERIAWIGPPE
jgi:hypothetical protein